MYYILQAAAAENPVFTRQPMYAFNYTLKLEDLRTGKEKSRRETSQR